MIFKNFKLNVILRVIVICLMIALLMNYLVIAEKYLRSAYLGVFLILAVWELLWYIDKSNRDFATFLLALLQDDFSTTFSADYKGKSFSMLYKAYNQITQKFRSINNDKELQHQYLLTLIAHINVGIISFDEGGNIHLVNNAFKEIIEKPFLNHINIIATIDPDLYQIISDISAGENKLYKINKGHILLELVIEASEFKLNNLRYKLVSFQNIADQLGENETQTWQKLMRVLTHEIMNSVTPITSLSDTLHHIVKQRINQDAESDNTTMRKIEEGLMVIKHRGQGLVSFTEAYKKLTRIPAPNFTRVKLLDLCNHIFVLLKARLEEADIDFKYNLSNNDLEIMADNELFSQVMINLIKNAIEALKDQTDPMIVINMARHGERHTIITVADNGPGMQKATLDRIFIPFFTTKEDGSGIGLSVSKQVIQLHKGALTVKSKPGTGTEFIILI